MTASPRSPFATILTVLVLVGILSSWATAVIPIESSSVEQDSDGMLVMNEVKTPLFYLAHGLAILSLTAAGILAALRNRLAQFGFAVKAALFVLAAAAAVWTAAAYSPGEILSTAIVGATGPFVWWTLILVAAGAEDVIWPYLERLIRGLAFASAALALHAVATTGEYGRYRGYSKFIAYAILLTWLGGWTLLRSAGARGWRLAVSAVPYAALVVAALYGQSRSWLINALLLGIGFLALRAKETQSGRDAWRAFAIGSLVLFAFACLVHVGWSDTLNSAYEGLTNRLGDDTRSNQYEDFFAGVPVTDLVLGRGPKGTWFWVGEGYFSYFDNGYLWTLFIGGLPVLLSYLAVLLLPCLRALRCRPGGGDAAAAGLLVLWGLALTGLSTFTLPSLSLPNYLVSLWAGRCQQFASGRQGESQA